MNQGISQSVFQQPKHCPVMEQSHSSFSGKGRCCDHNQPSAKPLSTKVALASPSPLPEGTQSLHFAVNNMKIEDIQQLLSQNPEAVHEKGFNGQTPLHKAVMSSTIQVIDLLLANKADPNALSDFEETPFHFACKRGDPTIVNLLLQNDANIKLVDQAGKGPVHHAAHGGSVLVLHFLTEACGLSTHVRDKSLSTPLHIVCAHGHTEALDYLLRNERSDLFAHNVYGNNAMHIAANAGNAWTCWRLLEEGGLQLLHEPNREGKRPLDLIKNQNDRKYKETADLLIYYTNCRQKNGKVKGPVLGWYAHGLLPLLSYPVLIILANQTSRAGAITLAGLIVLLIVLLQHSHRMKHVCRWPNPVYFTLFLSGMLHSMICFYYSVLPVIYDEHRHLVQIMIVWNMFSLYIYYIILTRDPGIAKESAKKPGSLWPYTIQDIADGTIRSRALCVVCEIIPPERSHHCKLCGKCYLKTDHHCLFLYRCIAVNNHRLFLGFVLVIIVEMLLFIYALTLYFVTLFPAHDSTSSMISAIFNSRPWEWSLFVGNAVFIFWGMKLLSFQLNVLSKGHTTAYQPNEGRTHLTYRERLYNILYFFMNWGYYALDTSGNSKEFNV